MIYVLIFILWTDNGIGNGRVVSQSSTTAEFNTEQACVNAADALYRQTHWAEKRAWTCSPKGPK